MTLIMTLVIQTKIFIESHDLSRSCLFCLKQRVGGKNF